MSTAGRLRVVHVVPDLGVGGAERHAATLMSHLDRTTFAPSLVCIGRRGELFDTLDPAVHAVALGRTKRQAFKTVLDLVRLFRGLSPDLVIVRGFNAELLGRVAAVLAGVRHTVVWVHNCGDVAPRGALRHVLDRALDPVTDAYFGVAHAQVPYIVEQLGLPESKVRIIHNGVDTEAMRVERPSVSGMSWDSTTSTRWWARLAALRPEKDLETFLHAAARVCGSSSAGSLPRRRRRTATDDAREPGPGARPRAPRRLHGAAHGRGSRPVGDGRLRAHLLHGGVLPHGAAGGDGLLDGCRVHRCGWHSRDRRRGGDRISGPTEGPGGPGRAFGRAPAVPGQDEAVRLRRRALVWRQSSPCAPASWRPNGRCWLSPVAVTMAHDSRFDSPWSWTRPTSGGSSCSCCTCSSPSTRTRWCRA